MFTTGIEPSSLKMTRNLLKDSLKRMNLFTKNDTISKSHDVEMNKDQLEKEAFIEFPPAHIKLTAILA
jgi:hypothetical protein